MYFTHAHRIAELLKKCGIEVDWKPNERVNLEKLAFRLVFNVAVSDMCYEISFWFTNPNTHGDSSKCEFSVPYLGDFTLTFCVLEISVAPVSSCSCPERCLKV